MTWDARWAASDLHLPVALEHCHLAAQLRGGGETRSAVRGMKTHVTHHMSHTTCHMSHHRGRGRHRHLIHVALAAGMHGLTDGALAPQFFDVPQKALDRLVLQRQGELICVHAEQQHAFCRFISCSCWFSDTRL